MEKALTRLLPPLILCWLVCAVDGVCVALGTQFLGYAGGNLATGIFFILFLVTLFEVRESRAVLKVFAWWAGIALGSLVGMLFAVWAILAAGGPAWLRRVCTVAMSLLSAPTASCTVMLFPIFLWSVVLVGSVSRLRHMKKDPRA